MVGYVKTQVSLKSFGVDSLKGSGIYWVLYAQQMELVFSNSNRPVRNEAEMLN